VIRPSAAVSAVNRSCAYVEVSRGGMAATVRAAIGPRGLGGAAVDGSGDLGETRPENSRPGRSRGERRQRLTRGSEVTT
jgi:hypothetical protein